MKMNEIMYGFLKGLLYFSRQSIIKEGTKQSRYDIGLIGVPNDQFYYDLVYKAVKEAGFHFFELKIYPEDTYSSKKVLYQLLCPLPPCLTVLDFNLEALTEQIYREFILKEREKPHQDELRVTTALEEIAHRFSQGGKPPKVVSTGQTLTIAFWDKKYTLRVGDVQE